MIFKVLPLLIVYDRQDLRLVMMKMLRKKLKRVICVQHPYTRVFVYLLPDIFFRDRCEKLVELQPDGLPLTDEIAIG